MILRSFPEAVIDNLVRRLVERNLDVFAAAVVGTYSLEGYSALAWDAPREGSFLVLRHLRLRNLPETTRRANDFPQR